MSDTASPIWIVFANEWEDWEVRGVLTSEEAAIAFAKDQVKRERRKRFGGMNIFIEKHWPDPAIGTRAKAAVVEYEEPLPLPLLPPGRGMFVASVGAITLTTSPPQESP